ncbi:DUF6266 family protein [Pedobacter gandavensis]|uniref:Uncharacterized protein n=1 Tax=Pedobacter gandavensis TaxID=2679963 RepID=A0ABR6EZ54_9SPHI|nr:DUF6266 family protein [Pedobacter gandavensis]MBB2150544.1 hypothetical protein [Pedobacter gandavensis]
MGKLFAGPWSDFQGKVGNNVGRYVNGENILAVKPHKSNKPATAFQLNQQDIFGRMNSIVTHWNEPIEEGFRKRSYRQTARSAAVEYNLKFAVTGVSPNREIDYTKLTFSRGKLAGAQNMKVINSIADPNFLTFSWIKDVNNKEAKDTDFVSFLIYCPALDRHTGLLKAFERSELTCDFAIPYIFNGQEIECYAYFTSADGLLVSDSQYAGNLLKA